MESNIQRHRSPSRRGSRNRAWKAPLMENVIVGKEEGAMADNISDLGRVNGGEGERSETGDSQLPSLPDVPDELRAGGLSERAQQGTVAGQERVVEPTEAATFDRLAAVQGRVEVGEKNAKKKRPREWALGSE